ncbi:uncharacterized protein LOC129231420 [Uloborus diversus]|uniref:uncharacterized protein LOC129231420 n=1 Tax=Uloborus diversus TaxID=327109 RepID=UPI002408FD24|nr:uncharacterized protein LOC129231420 [Uloborus diversus]XP_054721707.1 uncharacterized protein LOC129231420 [Uloborus diversus]
MLPLLIAFILFVGVHSSFPNYPPFNGLSHHPRMENMIDPVERSNHKSIQSNEILDCNWEDIRSGVGLKELQDLVEAVAENKGLSPFAVLRMLHRRMKNKEEENMLNAMDNMPLPDIFTQPILDLPPPMKIPPDTNKAPYALPPDVPMIHGTEDDTNVVIIPVAPSLPNRIPPMMKIESKPRKENSNSVNNIGPALGKASHMFSLLTPIRNGPLRPPLGATVRVDSGDSLSPINRDITVTVSPLMTLLEALRQAEIKYQNVLGLSHNSEFITLSHSASIDCFIVNSIDDVVKTEDYGWKVTIADRDGQVLYDNFCIPNGKDFLIKPGTLISLTYVPLL